LLLMKDFVLVKLILGFVWKSWRGLRRFDKSSTWSQTRRVPFRFSWLIELWNLFVWSWRCFKRFERSSRFQEEKEVSIPLRIQSGTYSTHKKFARFSISYSIAHVLGF
jgi:hypothetical protein